MPDNNQQGWDSHSAAYQESVHLPTDVAVYNVDIGTEADFHLVGDVRGKRVLELGCGGAQTSIAFAKQGAITTGVDFSSKQLEHARQLCLLEGVKVELHLGDLTNLAFLPAQSIDLVFSAFALGYVENLGRVFSAVHRVLKSGAP